MKLIKFYCPAVLDLLLTWNLIAASPDIVAATTDALARVGPRGGVGPDVPLTDKEHSAFNTIITVDGKDAKAIQAACDQAVKQTGAIVFLPAGIYSVETEIKVPGGIIVFGEGSKTVIQTVAKDTHLFSVTGDGVRFTRLKLARADQTSNADNRTWGISASRVKNLHIDHCELAGFSYASNFDADATVQVDHCLIHHNAQDGMGYGVAVSSGAQVLVCDNEFSENRHSLASNGALDWGALKEGEMRKHVPGFGKTHWDFIHNFVHGDSVPRVNQAAVDTHPGMDGTFRVEANRFEDMRFAIEPSDGSGEIIGNSFSNFHGDKPTAIWIFTYAHNGNPVENAMPNHITISNNTFGPDFADSEAKAASIKYRIDDGEQITVDGVLAPNTANGSTQAVPIPRQVPLEN
jgi:hypothetical protein